MKYNESFIESTIQNMVKGFAYHKIITDVSGKPIDFNYLYVNQAYENLTGLNREEIVGKTINEIVNFQETEEFDWIDFFGNVALSGTPVSIERYFKLLGKWCEVSVFSPEKEFFVTIFTDITVIKEKEIELVKKNNELIKSEQNIIKLAYYDSLTNLPNRLLFSDRLRNAMAVSKRKGTKVVIVYLDMDNFKTVNDCYGHSSGDNLLINAAKRIQLCMREYDTVARLSGDEFSVLMQDVDDVEGIVNVIERIKEVFLEPFHVGNSSLNITVSMGISVFPEDGDSVEDLLRNADTAMYKAKEIGKNSYQFFDNKMKTDLLRKLNIEIMLKNAIEKDEFCLLYQPQFEAQSKKLRGFEALIRWDNPKLGFLSPAEFISVAEETGMITSIGKWVLRTACKLLNEINTNYNSRIVIAVNISPVQLKQKNFFESVVKIVTSSGINPSWLELEFPERIFLEDFDFAISILNNLKEFGVRVALDGFGTGYSSLSYLKKLPIDVLKLDKSFVREIDSLNPSNDLTDSIISLVHRLNIKTFAGGVENKEQLEYLVNAKCDNVQGFYLGKPIPEEEIDNILRMSGL